MGAANTDLDLLGRIRERLAALGVMGKIHLAYPKGKVIVTSKGASVAKRDCYYLRIFSSTSIIRFYEKVGFSIERKEEKLRDIAYILREFGHGRRASIEWIRRYEYRMGVGRQRWFKRRRLLGLEEAEEEYRKFLARKRRLNE